MSGSLDMSLDDIIRKNKGSGGRNGNFRGGRSGSGLGPGPDSRFGRRDPIRSNPYPLRPAMQVAQPVLVGGGGGGGLDGNGESGTKLYVSNLDYGVTNEDITVLFSEVGDLLRYSIHYDRSGRSKGTAEVVFVHQTDALAAIKRYNNVQLDGKPMKIELVGVNLFTSSVPVPFTATSNTGKLNGALRRGQENIGAKGWGRGDHRFFSGQSQSQGQRPRRDRGEKKTAEELDSELEKYHLAAMKIN